MPKRKTKRSTSGKALKGWAGFTPFQLIVIGSVFLIFAVFYLA